MTRDERYAKIALGMIYEPGMTREAATAALIASGVKPKLATSPVVLSDIAPPAPAKRDDGTEAQAAKDKGA
jgi:hypothetical protein